MEALKVSCEESDDELSSKVIQIRKSLKELQIEVPNHCDSFIARCIRLQDGNSQKAVDLIQQFQRTIVELTSWNFPIYPSAYLDLYLSRVLIPAKTPRTDTESRIIIIQTRLWDPNKFNFDQITIFLWMLSQYVQANFVDNQRNGFVVIWDFSCFSVQQAWAVNHFKLLKVLKWMQNKAAGRFKQLHVIFHPRIVGILYNGVKPFLKEKLKNRIILHGDSVESLHKYVDPNNLPKFLGGPWPNEGNDYVDDVVWNGLLKPEMDELFKDMVKSGYPAR